MKCRLRIAITIIVALIAGIVEAQTVPGGPIHFFSFDGAIVDEVTGTVPSLAQGYSATDGYIGEAIHLDGSGMIELPLDLTPELLPNMTIIAMVKLDVLPADPDLRAEIWPTGYVLSDSRGLIYLSNQNKETSFFAAYSTKASISNSAHPALRDGWQMVALTRKQEDRTTAKGELKPHAVLTLYTDGRVSESAALWKGDRAEPTLRLGSISIGRSDKFRGSIDHLIIYDRVLTSDELLQLRSQLRRSRNSTSSRSTPSPVVDNQPPRQIEDGQAMSDSGAANDQNFPGDKPEIESEENVATIKPTITPAFTPQISDDSEGPSVSVDLDGIKGASGVPKGSATVEEGIERANKANRARDKEARDEAVRQAGIENSKAIDGMDPGISPPNLRENDLNQITDTEEGKDTLKGEDECGERAENKVGARTADQCLGSFGKPPAAPNLSDSDRVNYEVDLNHRMETSFSGNVRGSFIDVLDSGGRGTFSGFMKIGENSNRPCRIAIDDGVDRSADPDQAGNRCAGAAVGIIARAGQ